MANRACGVIRVTVGLVYQPMGIIPDCALRTYGSQCAIPSRLRYCESGYFRIGGLHVKKLRKNEKSLKATEVPADFEPQVIDETEDGTSR